MRGQIIERDGEQYIVTDVVRVTGNGAKFDGRVKFTLRRQSDGVLFSWLGTRHSKKVVPNAKLHRAIFGPFQNA